MQVTASIGHNFCGCRCAIGPPISRLGVFVQRSGIWSGGAPAAGFFMQRYRETKRA